VVHRVGVERRRTASSLSHKNSVVPAIRDASRIAIFEPLISVAIWANAGFAMNIEIVSRVAQEFRADKPKRIFRPPKCKTPPFERVFI
jgi:hypothetical protein